VNATEYTAANTINQRASGEATRNLSSVGKREGAPGSDPGCPSSIDALPSKGFAGERGPKGLAGGRAPATTQRDPGIPGAAAPSRLAWQYRNKSTVPGTKRLTGSVSKDGAYSPKYINACRQGAWSIVTWPRDHPEKAKVHCFKCRSWRHEGECAKWKGAQDFRRIEAALKNNPGFWVYMVFTFDPKDWFNEFQAYKGLLSCWEKFRLRFERKFGKFQYVNLCEKHKNGRPHINILIRNEKFGELCKENWRRIKSDWVEPHLIASGFGLNCYVEPVRDESAMAGYCVKLMNTIGEVVKTTQAPVNAPKNFRRLRASRGLLPPPIKNPDITGRLEMQPFEKVEHNWETIKKLCAAGGDLARRAKEILERGSKNDQAEQNGGFSGIRRPRGVTRPYLPG